MPKRPPGVYKRGSSWSVVIDHRDPATGARRKVWHSGFATMGEAAEARIRLLRERDTGSTVPASQMTLGQYLMDVWLPERKPAPGESARGHRGRLGVQSWQMYHEAMRRYVVPTLGGVRLQKLAARDLDQLYDALERTGGRKGTGLSPKTVANVHGVLHKALRDAVRSGLVARNVADLVGPPKSSRPQPRWWTPEQLGAFLRHVQGDRLYAMWLLFATTGMRRGEVLGLAWDDVDLVDARLSVRWTLGVVKAQPTWKREPKSRAGQRTMALDPATVQALRTHRAAQAQERLFAGPAWTETNEDWRGEQRSGLVFTWPDGTLINPARVSRWFTGHVNQAGLPHVRLHDVRH
jgi:integrase